MAFATIVQALAHNAEAFPGQTIINHQPKGHAAPVEVRWAELMGQIRQLAAGLIKLDLQRGDRVAIASFNRLEWIVADLGVMLAGGVSVAIYHTNTAPQCAHILADSGARFVVAENAEQLAKVQAHWPELPALERALIIDGPAPPEDERIIGWEAAMSLGRRISPRLAAELEWRQAKITADQLCTIVYTSGTTGPPKGCMESHQNIMAVLEAVDDFLEVDPAIDRSLLILPVSHLYPRVTGYYYNIHKNIPLALARSIDTAAEDMRAHRPTYFACVPRVFEKLYDRIMAQANAGPAWRKAIFNWAAQVGVRRSRLLLEHQPVPAALALAHRLADRLVFAKIREMLGGRLRFAVSAGAPLDAHIGLFIHAMGVHVLEYYGLTECVGGTVTTFEHTRYGTVGRPMKGVELMLADDGEILLRGNVFMGYWNQPEKTAEIIQDGWCHTGDVGVVDTDGYLHITDRKKDLIITAGGKNISPQNLEGQLARLPLVATALVHGDRRKHLCALLCLDEEQTQQWAGQHGLAGRDHAELCRLPQTLTFVQEQIDRLNAGLAQYETIKRFAIVPRPFSQEDGELTPTLKLKRRAIEAKFKDLLDSLYERA